MMGQALRPSREPLHVVFSLWSPRLLAAIYTCTFFLFLSKADWPYLSLASLPADTEDLLPLTQ